VDRLDKAELDGSSPVSPSGWTPYSDAGFGVSGGLEGTDGVPQGSPSLERAVGLVWAGDKGNPGGPCSALLPGAIPAMGVLVRIAGLLQLTRFGLVGARLSRSVEM
jgi:hypothetical protein